MSVLVTIGALALLALWAMRGYSKLVGLRRQVTDGWRQIDGHLKRRHHLISNLVTALKGVVDADRDTLEAVIAARQRAAGASGPADAGRRESELSTALARCVAIAESRLDSSANESVRALREELANLQNTIGDAREFYNNLARKYNTATEAIPGNIVAGFAGFKAAELFELTSDDERKVPPVDPSAPKG